MMLFANRSAGALLLLAACAAVPMAVAAQEDESAAMSMESSAQLSDAGRVFERWERILLSATHALVTLQCSRTSYRADDEHRMTSEVLRRQDVAAKAVMATDSHFLAVWETDPKGNETRKEPVLVLSFVDGTIHERLWYPALDQYRSKRYTAPNANGADDTDYIHGCQIGALLGSWLGEGWMVDDLRLLKAAEVIDVEMLNDGGMVDSMRLRSIGDEIKVDIINDEDEQILPGWTAVRTNDNKPIVDLETGELLYHRIDDYWFDPSGTLRRWRTTVFQGMVPERGPYFIVQDQRYSIRFTDEPPRGMAEAIQRMLEQHK